MQSDVACVLYRETLGASRYADRRFITGTLQDLIDGAELFLSRYIAVGARVEGFKRIDIPEYSLEALREAVINAIVHRDYRWRGCSARNIVAGAVGSTGASADQSGGVRSEVWFYHEQYLQAIDGSFG